MRTVSPPRWLPTRGAIKLHPRRTLRLKFVAIVATLSPLVLLEQGCAGTAGSHRDASIPAAHAVPADDGSADESRARTLLAQGLPQEALPFALAAVQKRRALLGDSHADVERAWELLADIHVARSLFQDAIDPLDRALQSSRARHGPSAADSAPLLERLAYVFSRIEDADRMESAALTAIAIRESTSGGSDPALADTLQMLGSYFLRCDDQRANRYLSRALSIIEKREGPRSPALAGVLDALSKLRWHRGDEQEARTTLRRASELEPPRSVREASSIVDVLTNLADGQNGQLDMDARAALALRAVETEVRWSGPRSARIPGLVAVLARRLDRAGHAGEASQAYLRWGVLSLVWEAPFDPGGIQTNVPPRQDPVIVPSGKPAQGPCSRAMSGGVPDAQRSVARLTPSFRQCYLVALRTAPSYQGMVRLSAEIDASGRVARVAGSAFAEAPPSMVACHMAALAAARFSPPQGGSAVIVIPITLAQQGKQAAAAAAAAPIPGG